MTNELITTTAALRASFDNDCSDPTRTALRLLDAALDTLLRAMPNPDQLCLDYLADDFHDDALFYLDIDPDADDDLPITTDMLTAMIRDMLDENFNA